MSMEKMDSESWENVSEGGRWIVGLGPKGLEEAKNFFKSRQAGGNPVVIEGQLGDEVVYREYSPGGDFPPNVNNVPKGKEDEVSYARVEYQKLAR